MREGVDGEGEGRVRSEAARIASLERERLERAVLIAKERETGLKTEIQLLIKCCIAFCRLNISIGELAGITLHMNDTILTSLGGCAVPHFE